LQYPDLAMQLRLYKEAISCSRPTFPIAVVKEFEYYYTHHNDILSLLLGEEHWAVVHSTLQRLHPQAEYDVKWGTLNDVNLRDGAWMQNFHENQYHPKGEKGLLLLVHLPDMGSHVVFIYEPTKLHPTTIITPTPFKPEKGPIVWVNKILLHYTEPLWPSLVGLDFGFYSDQLTTLYWSLWVIHARMAYPRRQMSHQQLLQFPMTIKLNDRPMVIQGFIDKFIYNCDLRFNRFMLDGDFEGRSVLQLSTAEHPLGCWGRNRERVTLEYYTYHEITLEQELAQPTSTTILADQLHVCTAAGNCHEFQLPTDVENALFGTPSIFSSNAFTEAAMRHLVQQYKDCVLFDLRIIVYYNYTDEFTDQHTDQHTDPHNFHYKMYDAEAYPQQYPWNKLSERILYSTCYNRIIAVPLNIIGKNKEGVVFAHANMLFFDLDHNIIEHYEPHGSQTDESYGGSAFSDSLVNQLQLSFNEMTYQPPIQICPDTHCGFQAVLNRQCTTDVLHKSCALWCLYFMNDRLQHPELTAFEVFRKTYRLLIPSIDNQTIAAEIKAFAIMLAKLLKLRLIPMVCACNTLTIKYLMDTKGFPWANGGVAHLKRVGGKRVGDKYHMISAVVEDGKTLVHYLDITKQPQLDQAQRDFFTREYLQGGVTQCQR